MFQNSSVIESGFENNNQHCLIALSTGMISVRCSFWRGDIEDCFLGLPKSIPAETNRVVQVKYTNPQAKREILRDKFLIFQTGPTDIGSLKRFQGAEGERESMTFGSETGLRACQLLRSRVTSQRKTSSLSLSGSNQAREGRLVDALAVRGDERRDTLR